MKGVLAEIKRRRVIPVAAYYVLGVWLVLQVADILLPAWGVSARAIRLIIYAALLGFPIALVFGWRYDLGAAGITRTQPAHAQETVNVIVKPSGKDILLLLIMSLSLVAIGGWLIDQVLYGEPGLPTSAPNTVAVLAFENNTGSDDLFATDLASQIITTLIQIEGLKVTGRESSFYFSGRSFTLERIAGMLSVRYLLTGQISQHGQQLSISLQLVRMPDGSAIWARDFMVAADEVYVIFNEIGEAVANTMRVNVSDEARRKLLAKPVGDKQALDLMRLSETAAESGDMERAFALIEQAIERDSKIAHAHVLKALYYLLSFSNSGTPTVEVVRSVARESLDKAEALGAEDPDYYLARGLQARREIWMDGGTPAWHKALESSFSRAISLNPSDAQAYVSLSIYYRRNRRYTEATSLLETALDYDPLHPGAILQYSRNLSALGRFDEAIEYAKRLPELFGFGEREIAFRYQESQQLDQAIEWFLKAPASDPRNKIQIASILSSLGESAGAISWLNKVSDDEFFGPYAASSILALEGKYESAFNLMAGHINDEKQHPDWLRQLARLAVRLNRPERAIAYLERLAPALADPLAPEVNEQNAEDAVLLAVSLGHGEDNEVRVGILSGMLLNMTRNRPAIGFDGIGLRAARVYALQGQTENAITAFQSAYERGFRRIYTAEGKLPQPLEGLVGNPLFDQLIDTIDVELAAMQLRAKSLIEGH